MPGKFRSHTANWLAGGAHMMILYGAMQANSAAAWPFALGAMSLVSFAAWVGNYRRLLQVADTPLSNIATAAQGYVEISGRAKMPGGTPILAMLSHTPCFWYQYEVRKKNDDETDSFPRDAGASDEPFIIEDATGQCVIDPQNSEVLTSRENSWAQGNEQYTEWLLLPKDEVYALGDFVTVGGANAELNLDADVGNLLAEWKKNQPELIKRFDLNQDGAIDLKEWELARRQAVREVEAQHREVRADAGTNVLRAPADGRLFLISNYIPGNLRLRYRLWTWAHALIFIGAGAGVCLFF